MFPTVRATRPGIDGLHPNSAGMRAMADAVNLALLK
jgi:lysophospholipase L1-like esterase